MTNTESQTTPEEFHAEHCPNDWHGAHHPECPYNKSQMTNDLLPPHLIHAVAGILHALAAIQPECRADVLREAQARLAPKSHLRLVIDNVEA